jgi:formamidopyrimidine-DNA glycosylase
MPEISDLEVIRQYLKPRPQNRTIASFEAPILWRIRTGADELQTLLDRRLVDILRHGKFLLFNLDDGRVLVINTMLTGRFHWVEVWAKKPGWPGVVFGFDDGHELRYSDMRRMARFYLTDADQPEVIPQFAKMGPALMAIDEEQFTALIARRRGQIKNTLTNPEFVAGIDNAYSDEILWEAKLQPRRKRSTMDADDIYQLFEATRTVIERSSAAVDEIIQSESIGRKDEWREHLSVHRKGEGPCPRCESPIKGQTRGGSETNYCVQCQSLFA